MLPTTSRRLETCRKRDVPLSRESLSARSGRMPGDAMNPAPTARPTDVTYLLPTTWSVARATSVPPAQAQLPPTTSAMTAARMRCRRVPSGIALTYPCPHWLRPLPLPHGRTIWRKFVMCLLPWCSGTHGPSTNLPPLCPPSCERIARSLPLRKSPGFRWPPRRSSRPCRPGRKMPSGIQSTLTIALRAMPSFSSADITAEQSPTPMPSGRQQVAPFPSVAAGDYSG